MLISLGEIFKTVKNPSVLSLTFFFETLSAMKYTAANIHSAIKMINGTKRFLTDFISEVLSPGIDYYSGSYENYGNNDHKYNKDRGCS